LFVFQYFVSNENNQWLMYRCNEQFFRVISSPQQQEKKPKHFNSWSKNTKDKKEN